MRQNQMQFLSKTTFLLLFPAVLAVTERDCHAEQFDGYTEPYDTVNVAAAETGIVETVVVREGQVVQEGQVLAKLDDKLYLVLLAIAGETMRTKGELNSALAELHLQQHRFEKLKVVRAQGHARQEEVERAEADVAIAEARVLTAKENLIIKKLEHQRIKVQIVRRTIRAPMDGVITKIHKKKGEYVGLNDPYLLEMVKLNPLLAKFSLPSQRARKLREGQTVTLYVEPSGKTVRGTIEFIGPVTDAQSATVQIKARIDNHEGKFFSGEQCTLQFPDKELAQHTN
jgi:RND family efflux transporter MFP subunit